MSAPSGGHEEQKNGESDDDDGMMVVASSTSYKKSIQTAIEDIKSNMRMHSIDPSVQDNVNQFAAFSEFALKMHMPEAYKACLADLSMTLYPTKATVLYKDTAQEGTMQHYRTLVAAQQLAYAYVAITMSPQEEEVKEEMHDWIQHRYMDTNDLQSNVDNLQTEKGVFKAIASYSSHGVPRSFKSLLSHSAEKEEKCTLGYNTADALRLQKACQK